LPFNFFSATEFPCWSVPLKSGAIMPSFNSAIGRFIECDRKITKIETKSTPALAGKSKIYLLISLYAFMALGCISMSPLNIFINRMFKSYISRAGCVVLAGFITAVPVFGTGLQDSIPGTGTLSDTLNETSTAENMDPVADSTLIYLMGTTFNRMLDQAIDYQRKADSLQRLSVEWRKQAARMDDPVSRGRIQKQIVQIEDSVAIFTNLANEHFSYLNAGIPEKAKKEPQHPFLIKDTVLDGITVYNYNLNEEFITLLEEIRTPKGDAITDQVAVVKKDVSSTGAKGPLPAVSKVPPASGPSDTESPAAGLPAAGLPAAGFRIYDTSPYSGDNPVERDYTIPPGVFYRIQLAVYRNELQADHFGGLSPITTEAIPERGLTRYFVGKFTRMEEVRTALVKVRALGYPDAFIVGYYNGQKSSFSKLKALEK